MQWFLTSKGLGNTVAAASCVADGYMLGGVKMGLTGKLGCDWVGAWMHAIVP